MLVEVDDNSASLFKVTYDNGQTVEVLQSLIRELPPEE
jgi:hypothetical protein